jgi:hypothetical protein
MSKTIKILVPVLIIVIVAAIFAKVVIVNSKREAEKIEIRSLWQEDAIIYTLTIGGIAGDSNAPEPGKEQRVLIRLNGNPLRIYTSGKRIVLLNYYLCPGQNKLEFENLFGLLYAGRFVNPFKVSIAKFNEKTSSMDLILEKEITAIKSGETIEMVFDANIPYRLPIYEPNATVPGESSTTRARITTLLGDMYNKIAKRDKDGFLKMNKNIFEWQFASLGYSQEKVDEMTKLYAEMLFSKETKLGPFWGKGYKFIWGKQFVMVYLNFEDTGLRQPYLFEYSTNGKKNYYPAVTVAYINGTWEIWPEG